MKSFYLLVCLSLLSTIGISQRVYEVTTAADVDDGNCSTLHCSLREAINAANEDGVANRIVFDIRANGPQVLYLNSELPAIQGRETVIDATTLINNFPTQGLVVLDGQNRIPKGLSIQASDFQLLGFQIQNFTDAAIAIGDGVNEITEILIGEASKGNIFLSNGTAIFVNKAKTTTFHANLFGTNLNFEPGLGNTNGLVVNNEIESEIFIGGNAFDGEGNLFASHQESAIQLSYNGYASIAGNRIGTGNNQEKLGNKIGIRASNPNGTLDIGGARSTKNLIANNVDGILIEVSDKLSISQNDFICNTNSIRNLFRQYAPPVIEYGIETVITGIAAPNDIIEIYISEENCESTHCNGMTFLGQVIATTSGSWLFPGFYQYGQHVVALARSSTNTSSFSKCLRICPPDLRANAIGSALYCKEEVIDLRGDFELIGRQWVTVFNDNDITYHWRGPKDFTADQQHISNVTEEGLYILEANLFGCSSVLDTVDVKIVEFDVVADNTGPYCEATSFDLISEVTANVEEVQYQWTGPNNFHSTEATPINVKELGTYALQISAAGCTSEISRTTVVNHEYPTFSLGEDRSICEGTSIDFNLTDHKVYQWSAPFEMTCDTCGSIQISPNENTSLILTAGDHVNCVNTDTVFIQVKKAIRTGEEKLLCPNSSLTIFDAVITEAGTYATTFLASTGCDSIHTIIVHALEENRVVVPITICEGDSYSIFGIEQTIANSYSQHFIASNGCDSIHTIDLTVLPNKNTEEQRTLCEGEASRVFGMPQSETGSYTKTFTSYTGCDSMHTVHVVVHPNLSVHETITTCEGESILIFGAAVTLPGLYTQTFTSVAGCDSIHQIELDFKSFISTEERRFICEEEAILVFGESIDQEGVFERTFASQYGCDSVHAVKVYKAISKQVEEQIVLCEGTSFFAFGEAISTAGIYQKTLVSQEGCDSTQVYQIEIIAAKVAEEIKTICEGESTLVFENTINEAGSYTQQFIASTGCDSTHTIHLEILEQFFVVENISICEGEVYWLNDSTKIASSGTFEEHLFSSNTCDSTHQTNIVVLEKKLTEEYLIVCEGEEVMLFGKKETASGRYEKVFLAANGCDSIHAIYLDVIEPIESVAYLNTCANEPYYFNDKLISNSGSYSKALLGKNGCDSTHILHIVIEEEIATFETLELCNGESIPLFGEPISLPGTYTKSFKAIGGCDSIHTILLNTHAPVIVTSNHTFCEGETVLVNGESLSNSATIEKVYLDQNGCDSTHISQVTILPNHRIEEQQIICATDCAALFNATICASGIWEQRLINQAGCDSIHITQLTILETAYTSSNISLCAGDSTRVFGTLLEESGSYTQTFKSMDGCDSIHTIHVELLSPLEIGINIQHTCPLIESGSIQLSVSGSLPPYQFHWADSPNNQAKLSELSTGSYEVTIADANNCSTTKNLLIEAYPQPVYSIEPMPISCYNAADGALLINTSDSLFYQVNGTPYSKEFLYENLAAGEYTIQLKDEHNCRYQEQIRLIDPPPLFVELPAEISIQLGEEITLAPTIIYPKSVNYEWDSPTAINCFDCSEITIRPFKDTPVDLIVYDENNCVGQASVFIKVNQKKEVYIPSAFSPTGDGHNEHFLIYSSTSPIENIEVFRVFDRWGNLVFDAANIQPNLPDLGWDGTFNGQIMGPGIYIYYTKIHFVDGTTQFFEGDVTLVR